VNIRVLLCDEQTVALEGLRAILDRHSDLRVVGETQNVREVARLASELRPDVVLLGLPSDHLNLAVSVNELLSNAGEEALHILALAASERQQGLLEALHAGVRGIVDKASPPEELLRGVRAVAAGEAALTPSITRRLLEWALAKNPVIIEPPVPVRALSAREIAVLELLAQGASDDEVAERLHVSKPTVRSHVHNLLGKLGLRSRCQAVAYAYRHGLVAASTRAHGKG
jgi:DNA-binding NarL/FixJ family response regulator